MISRVELKTRAKKDLGEGIFKSKWLWALLVCVIATAVDSIPNFITGVGSVIVLVISGPIAAGLAGYFQKLSRNEEVGIGNLFDAFKKDFGGYFLLGLLISIFTALWSLLFVVPGIIKSYSYSMAFYLKNDNNELKWKEAIKKSQELMKGHKGELFVLDLSFIGWYIVGALCLGIGTCWVVPYHNAARAEFYAALKAAKAPQAEEAPAAAPEA